MVLALGYCKDALLEHAAAVRTRCSNTQLLISLCFSHCALFYLYYLYLLIALCFSLAVLPVSGTLSATLLVSLTPLAAARRCSRRERERERERERLMSAVAAARRYSQE